MDWQNFDWPDIFRRLTLFAFRRRQLRGLPGSLVDAEDLAAEAVRRLIDDDYAQWDRDREPDVLRQLGSIVNGLLSNELRAGRIKRERTMDAPEVREFLRDLSEADDTVADREECRRALSLLEQRIADDVISRKLFALEREGISKPSEQAERLALPIDTVYKARRRLAAHREEVRLELQQENLPEKPQTKPHHLSWPSA